ncbi:MAG: hypothetical protein HGN29_15060 [Asgard group archaeon]|nr:hypothetical protein [Asgard group archaeon]
MKTEILAVGKHAVGRMVYLMALFQELNRSYYSDLVLDTTNDKLKQLYNLLADL